MKGIQLYVHSLLRLYPDRLNPVKELRYPLNTMLGWLQIQSERVGEDRTLLPVPGFEPWSVQPVAQSLCRMRYSIYSGKRKYYRTASV